MSLLLAGCGIVGLEPLDLEGDTSVDPVVGLGGGAIDGEVSIDQPKPMGGATSGSGGRQSGSGGSTASGGRDSASGGNGSSSGGSDAGSGGTTGGSTTGGAPSSGGAGTGGSSDGSGGVSSGGSGGMMSGGTGGSDGTETGGTNGTGGDGSGGANTGGTGGTNSGGSMGMGGMPECVPNCTIDPATVISIETFDESPDGDLWTSGGGQLTITDDFGYLDDTAMCGVQGSQVSEAEIREFIPLHSSGPFYFRAWVYLPVGAVNGRMKLLGLNHSVGVALDYSVVAGGAAEVRTVEHGTTNRSSGGVVPEGEWFCLQASTLVSNGSDGWMTMAINETIVASLQNVDTRPGQGIDLVVYGLAHTDQGQRNGEVCLDDVVVDTAPIPCQ